MQKVSGVLFSLQGCVEQGIWLICADVVNKFANRLLAHFTRVIANDEVCSLVDGHGTPPIICHSEEAHRVTEESPHHVEDPSLGSG